MDAVKTAAATLLLLALIIPAAAKQPDRGVKTSIYGTGVVTGSHHLSYLSFYIHPYGSKPSSDYKPSWPGEEIGYWGAFCDQDRYTCQGGKIQVAGKFNVTLSSGTDSVVWTGDGSKDYYYNRYGPAGDSYPTAPNIPGNYLNLKPGKYSYGPLFTRFTEDSDTDWDRASLAFSYDANTKRLIVRPKATAENLKVQMEKNPPAILGNPPPELQIIRLESDTGDNSTVLQKSVDTNAGLIEVTETDLSISGGSTKYYTPKMGVVFEPNADGLYKYVNWSSVSGDKGTCVSSEDTPCGVVKTTFTYKDDAVNTENCGTKCPLGHFKAANKDFSSKRDVAYTNLYEIVVGWRYGDNENVESVNSVYNPPKFHMCGEFRLKGSNPVYSPSGKSKDRFVCNSATGNWKRVTVCNDGVDNDGDGTADLRGTEPVYGSGGLPEDGGCSGLGDHSEKIGSSKKEPRVGLVKKTVKNNRGLEDRKVAFYGAGSKYTDQLTGKTYGSFQAEIPAMAKNKTEFVCDNSGNIVQHPLVSTSDIKKSSLSAGEVEKKMQYQANQVCDAIAGRIPSKHDDRMPVAQIKLNESYIPYGKTFAIEAGYYPFAYELLARAEEEIDSDSPHRYQSYVDKGIPESYADPYKDPEQTDQLSNAWTVGNILAPENPRIRSVNPVYTKNNVMRGFEPFKGGYAGKCPESNRWGYYNDSSGETNYVWRCRPENYKTYFDYVMPDVEENPTDTVGFKLIPASFIKFRWATGNQLDSIEGACWRGQPSDRPSNIASSDSAARFGSAPKYNDIAEPTLQQTLAKVGDSFNVNVTGVPTDSPGEFTCAWNLTDTKGTVYEGGKLFQKYNWFSEQNSAQEIVNNVESNVESGKWPEIVKKLIVPDYYALKNITEIKSKVSSDFFRRDEILN